MNRTNTSRPLGWIRTIRSSRIRIPLDIPINLLSVEMEVVELDEKAEHEWNKVDFKRLKV